MPNEVLPNKREVMLALLAETSVFVHLDPRPPSVRVPPWFKNQPQLVLQIGLNMAVQIPDLDVNEQGITCTLSFSRRPFFCSIPWKAVFGLVGDNGPGLVWPDDVPAEIAAQVQAQTQAQVQKTPTKKPSSREAQRGRLRAVGSEAAPASAPSTQSASCSEPGRNAATPQAMPAATLAPEPKPDQKAEDAAPSSGPASDDVAGTPKAAESSRKPDQGNRPGSKRELPPYLRVVK